MQVLAHLIQQFVNKSYNVDSCSPVSLRLMGTQVLQDTSAARFLLSYNFSQWSIKQFWNLVPTQTNRSLPLMDNDWLTWQSMNFHVVKTQLSWESMLFTMKSHECPCTFTEFQSQFRLGMSRETLSCKHKLNMYQHLFYIFSLVIYCRTANFYVQEIFPIFGRFTKISCSWILPEETRGHTLSLRRSSIPRFAKISCTRIA